jgi:5'/3'-nucleotidase
MLFSREDVYEIQNGCFMMKTILLINDDGIQSSGLLAIKKKLDGLGRVVVVAPKDEVSGIGKAITSAKHIQIEEVELRDKSKAYAVVGGTPADAYILAVNKVLKRSPDVAVSGINLGPNLGIDDFLNSGTIGAALEAAIHGVPAVALSYCKHEVDDSKAKADITVDELELAADVGSRIVKCVLAEGLPPDVDLISVNVPEGADCRKLRVTELSYVGYGDLFTKEPEGYKIAHWRLSEYNDPHPETDVHVIRSEACISLTPVKVELPHNKKALEDFVKSCL